MIDWIVQLWNRFLSFAASLCGKTADYCSKKNVSYKSTDIKVVNAKVKKVKVKRKTN